MATMVPPERTQVDESAAAFAELQDIESADKALTEKHKVLAQKENELRKLRHEIESEAEQLEWRRSNANETLARVRGPQIADTITAINDQENELLYGRGTYEPKQQSD